MYELRGGFFVSGGRELPQASVVVWLNEAPRNLPEKSAKRWRIEPLATTWVFEVLVSVYS